MQVLLDRTLNYNWLERPVNNMIYSISLRNNQLSGCLLQPIPPSVKKYQLDSNFFSCGFSSPPDCSQTIIAVQANCLGATYVPPCPMDPQRVTEVCASFCGLSATSLPCAGHGTCFYSGPNRIPTCACNTGYTNGELPGTCVAVAAAGGATPADFSLLTSISVASGDGGGAAMAVSGAAATQPDNSVVLTSNQEAAWGAAFLVSRVRLFSYAVKNHSCGREIALKLSFSFSIAPATASNGVDKGGLAFVIAATNAVPGGDGSTLGYSGMNERSIAVEFDTFQDASSSDPDSSHVGINIGGSVVSISTAAVPGLNSGSTKYAWIDYSPGKGGLLAVYVGTTASRPAKPVLRRSVSLCGVLKPTFEDATFVVGFTAASSDPPQKHTVLQWSLDTDFPTQDTVTALPLGFTLAEASFTTSGVNLYFRYASAGALQPPAGAAPGASTDVEQQWAVATNMTWVRTDLLPNWSVPNQAGCGNCWAYAVVASIEAAYAILSANGSLPVFSVDSLVADMKADCSGGSPSKAFQYLLSVSKRGGGLEVQQVGGGGGARVRKGGGRGATGVAVAAGSGDAVGLQGKQGKQGTPTAAAVAAAAAAAGQSPLCSPLLKPIAALFGVNCTPPKQRTGPTVVRPGYSITGFERAAFYSWFGLVLAVQRQPVVVHIEASADSFLNYDGLHKYQDPACFTYNLNHVVLLVGYRLVGFDEAFPHMAPPYWIIRNSWGPDWGDGGYMLMDIQGGDGVCGINTLPGIYPIVLDKQDPCNGRAHHDTIGAVLNPCGNFACTRTADGKSNRCDCNTATDGRFIEAINTDGSRTCAYVDACAAQIRNPCAVGTCVNDGAGSYSCVCPPGFRQGTTVDGTFSCAPGSTNGTYTVISNNVKCSDVFPIYGLSLEQLKQQNPAIACEAPLPLGSVLQVAPPTTVTPCTVYYTTEEGDTCEALATYFALASTCPSPECTAALQALNPGVDCSANSGQLPASQAVCVERRAEMAGVVALCSQYYFVESAETCESIRNVPDPPLSRVDFYRLNPGIKCSRLVPKTDVGSFTGFEACVGSTDSLLQGTCPRATAITIGTGDRCTAIQVKTPLNAMARKRKSAAEAASATPRDLTEIPYIAWMHKQLSSGRKPTGPQPWDTPSRGDTSYQAPRDVPTCGRRNADRVASSRSPDATTYDEGEDDADYNEEAYCTDDDADSGEEPDKGMSDSDAESDDDDAIKESQPATPPVRRGRGKAGPGEKGATVGGEPPRRPPKTREPMPVKCSVWSPTESTILVAARWFMKDELEPLLGKQGSQYWARLVRHIESENEGWVRGVHAVQKQWRNLVQMYKQLHKADKASGNGVVCKPPWWQYMVLFQNNRAVAAPHAVAAGGATHVNAPTGFAVPSTSAPCTSTPTFTGEQLPRALHVFSMFVQTSRCELSLSFTLYIIRHIISPNSMSSLL
ncbi:unnamed protein product [Closterium sp. NIES-65]|nr:unnamed protein product [Closterium sp. NIES-65]